MKHDYVGDSPFIGYAAKPDNEGSMGVFKIPWHYVDDGANLELMVTFRELLEKAQKNICVLIGTWNGNYFFDLISSIESENLTIIFWNLQMTASDMDSYPKTTNV